MRYLFDASAVIAVLRGETGGERVIEATGEAAIGAANLAEVVARLSEDSDTTEGIEEALAVLRLPVIAVEEADGMVAGLMRRTTKPSGLSLGDRLCLAMAVRRNLTVIAADRAFGEVSAAIGAQVELIR